MCTSISFCAVVIASNYIGEGDALPLHLTNPHALTIGTKLHASVRVQQEKTINFFLHALTIGAVLPASVCHQYGTPPSYSWFRNTRGGGLGILHFTTELSENGQNTGRKSLPGAATPPVFLEIE